MEKDPLAELVRLSEEMGLYNTEAMVMQNLADSQKMSDEQFLDFVLKISEAKQHLFCLEMLRRLWSLAGEPFPVGFERQPWWSFDDWTIGPLVDRAREKLVRSNELS